MRKLTCALVLICCANVWANDPAPKLYGLCVEMPAVPNASVASQAGLLRELGFEGVGYPLWFGDDLDKKLRVLDQSGLDLHLAYTTVNIHPRSPAFDPRLPDTFSKLDGRPVTIAVLLQGYPPSDPRGTEPAVRILRELGDLASKSHVRISIYHHVNDWTESLLHALEVVKQVDHPCVGVNFNLCHWLKVEGNKDYRPVLQANANRIFAVTINGAQSGTDTWTDGLIQPLDRGDFDNLELLKTLRRVGYDGPIGLMCYGIPDDTRDHLGRSMNVWKHWHAD
jgi:sugar phosphate isomerase/epimerase